MILHLTCAACRKKFNKRTNRIHKYKWCNRCAKYLRNQHSRDLARAMVRLRDKHTCQLCGKKWRGGRQFDVHHLNDMCGKNSRGYDRVGDIAGMITYCHKCHISLHSVKAKILGGKKVNIAEARRLRKTGLSYDKIAKKVNSTYASVYKAIKI